jgi:hypothetical protein
MKRKCDGCRALETNGCGLGYKTQATSVFDGLITKFKPLEECPKPKTYDKYCALLK